MQKPKGTATGRGLWQASERIYLDADGQPVTAGDPAAATLLVAAGDTIPLEQAKELGLSTATQPKPRTPGGAKPRTPQGQKGRTKK